MDASPHAKAIYHYKSIYNVSTNLFNKEYKPSRSNQSFENDEDDHTQSGYDHEWLDPDVGGAGPRNYQITENQHLFQLNSARYTILQFDCRVVTYKFSYLNSVTSI